jgi:hypothetical protein
MTKLNGVIIGVVAALATSGGQAWAKRSPTVDTRVGVAASAFMAASDGGTGGGVLLELRGGLSRRVSRGGVLGLEATGATGGATGKEVDLWALSVTAAAGATRYALTLSVAADKNISFEQRHMAAGVRLRSRRYGRLDLHVTPLARLTAIPFDAVESEYDVISAGGAWEGHRAPMILRVRYERGRAANHTVYGPYRRSGVELAVGDERGSFGLIIDNEALATKNQAGVVENQYGWTTIGLRMGINL